MHASRWFTFPTVAADEPTVDVTEASPIDVIRERVRRAVELFDSLFGGTRRKLNDLAFRAMDIEKKYGPGTPIANEVWRKTLALRHRWNKIRGEDADDKNKAIAHVQEKGGDVTASQQFKPLLDGLDPNTGRVSEPDPHANPFLGDTSGLGMAVGTVIVIAIGLIAATFAIAWLGRIVTRYQETRALEIEADAMLKLFQKLLEAGVTPAQAAALLGIKYAPKGAKPATQFAAGMSPLLLVAGGALVVALLLRPKKGAA